MYFMLTFLIVPFTGVLVRHRVAYYPKATPLPQAQAVADSDIEAALPQATKNSDIQPSSNIAITLPDAGFSSNGPSEADRVGACPPMQQVPTCPSFFGVAKRVYQLEGKSGFFKGVLPTFIVGFLTSLFARNSLPRLYISPAPSIRNGSLLGSFVGAVFYCFALVWVYRSIVVRARLEMFGTSIKDALGALCSHEERAKPYKTLTPALLSALLGQILLEFFIFRPIRQLILAPPNQPMDKIFFLRLGATGLLLFIGTVISAPLDVIVTRLAAQRTYGTPGVVREEQAPLDATMPEMKEKGTDKDGELQPHAENLVVRYRGEDLEPYKNVYDCAQKIIKEEGWRVLYRGWLFTLLGRI